MNQIAIIDASLLPTFYAAHFMYSPRTIVFIRILYNPHLKSQIQLFCCLAVITLAQADKLSEKGFSCFFVILILNLHDILSKITQRIEYFYNYF